jgi:Zn-dependent protease with chaperone function
MKIFFLLAIAALALLWAWYLAKLALPRLFRRLEVNPIRPEPMWLQVRERLRTISAAYRVPAPELCVLPEFSPNAMLLRIGRRAHIVLSEGLVRTLSGEELDAALALCLTHVYGRGRTLHTLIALSLFPLAQLLQNMPFVLQFLLSPTLSLGLRLAARPGRVFRADNFAARQTSTFQIAATLQKLAVLDRKIPIERWNLAMDSLFLISPLVLESQPFFLPILQPTVQLRRSRLLGPSACET